MKIYPIIFCLSLYIPLTNLKNIRSLLDINIARVRLVISTVLTLTFLTCLFYQIYGWEFIENTYLYHVTRKDTRHNFSVYFYLLYLTVEYDDIGLNLTTFLPQLVLLLLITYKFSNIYDLNFCIFCQTLVFVTEMTTALEAFFESGPQIIHQFYIVFAKKEITATQVISITLSLVMMAKTTVIISLNMY